MARTKRRAVSRWDDAPDYRNAPKHKSRPRPPAPVSIRQIDYGAYLKSNHWLDLRQRLFAERGCCEVCDSASNLTLHHLRYTRKGVSILWNEQDGDLMVLCWKCHKAWEAHCKGQKLNTQAVEATRELLTYGLERGAAFQVAVSPDCEALVARYKDAHEQRCQEISRRKREQRASEMDLVGEYVFIDIT